MFSSAHCKGYRDRVSRGQHSVIDFAGGACRLEITVWFHGSGTQSALVFLWLYLCVRVCVRVYVWMCTCVRMYMWGWRCRGSKDATQIIAIQILKTSLPHRANDLEKWSATKNELIKSITSLTEWIPRASWSTVAWWQVTRCFCISHRLCYNHLTWWF